MRDIVMPLFGSHMPIAGGLHRAVEAAVEAGMETVQMFTASPNRWAVQETEAEKDARQWKARDFTDEEVRRFREALAASGLQFATAHDSYLINLASPDEALYRRSVEAFVVELQRAEQLGLRYLVMHPGAHVNSGEDAGLVRVAHALDEVHSRCPNYRCQVLIETTAGQGTTLGRRFEELARLRSLVAAPGWLGVCFDTCHVFAAGYPLAPREEYEKTMAEFDRLVGLENLRVFHVNDSLKPLGSRVDRHAHIGRGYLGLEPFRLLVNDPRFQDRPMILETPKEEGDNDDMDTVNVGVLRGLVRGE
jgi:deoxyribonuclease IV